MAGDGLFEGVTSGKPLEDFKYGNMMARFMLREDTSLAAVLQQGYGAKKWKQVELVRMVVAWSYDTAVEMVIKCHTQEVFWRHI